MKITDDIYMVISEFLVKNDFLRERSVHHAHKNTKNDSVMTVFGFVFDLNFEYSYQYFKDNEFINKMFDMLENKDIFEEYVEKINEYVERKCNNVRDKVFS